MGYTFDLFFKEPSKEGVSGHRIAQICINHCSKTEKGAMKGAILITPECITMKELDEQIDRLKEELEIVREKARQKFSKLKK
jgi:hypothetical protein